MSRILIIDDEPDVLKWLKKVLEGDGHSVATVRAADLALKLLGNMPVDIIITDYAMPGMDGIEFLRIARERCPGVPVVMVTGHATEDTPSEAITSGAFDYLTKPFAIQDMRDVLVAAEEYLKAGDHIRNLLNPNPAHFPYPNIVAASSAMIEVTIEMERAAKISAPVLIQGERGTGKSIIARTIHACSTKREGYFFEIDCRNLASVDAIGLLLEHAIGGTVFFKDVIEMPLDLQRQLVLAVASRTYQKPSTDQYVPFKSRVFASTTKPLAPLVEKGAFSPALFRDPEAIVLAIPPLRERPEDVRALIGHLLRQGTPKAEGSAPIDPAALLVLENYPWPGNIPELEETIQNAYALSRGKRIRIANLPKEVVAYAQGEASQHVYRTKLDQFKGRAVRRMMEYHQRQKQAAPPTPSP